MNNCYHSIFSEGKVLFDYGGNMSRVVCGCSLLISRIDDGKDEMRLGECEVCTANKGDYTKSPHWTELVPSSPLARNSSTGVVTLFPAAMEAHSQSGKDRKRNRP